MGVHSITIVIPAFNESSRLPSTLDRLLEELDASLSAPWDIVVVDDGSSDGTAAVAGVVAERDPRVRVISSPVNRGKGAAVSTGFLAATGDLVLLVDADLPVPVESLSSFVARLDDADLACGSRRLPQSTFTEPQPFVRRVGAGAFLGVVRRLGLLVTTDPQCGVKALRRDRLAEIVPAVESEGFAFDIELIIRATRAGRITVEVPVRWTHVAGSSVRPVRDGVGTVAQLVRLRRRLGPARRTGRARPLA